ncbi:hypothetical protein TNCT_134521 [Trichonephila clavata]|uniref:DUF4817 domain-containing protein n=1 Tax=Trichonephila clavata TaxID=2740835 RepID=A0A8X6FXG7_TRICU|nr:hypothetical protein TNCT_134521 [Trichonephila clavata]
MRPDDLKKSNDISKSLDCTSGSEGVPKKRGQNDKADQSYNKDQRSHRNMGSQTPVEGARTTRGHCGADTSRAKGDWIHSSRGCVGRNMASYTHRELADMHLVYGRANCNGQKALRMYRQKYPSRKMTSYSFFVHRRLCGTSSLDVHKPDSGHQRISRTVDAEERVVHALQRNPSPILIPRDPYSPNYRLANCTRRRTLPISFTTRPGTSTGRLQQSYGFCVWVSARKGCRPTFRCKCSVHG